MKRLYALSKNEDGFVLITALVMLVILTLMGTFALNTTVFELQISGNDKVAKQTFYKADGGVQAGIELIEQNLGCPSGFSPSTTIIGGIDINDQQFAYVEKVSDINGAVDETTEDAVPSDDIRAIRIPDDPTSRVDTAPRTNLAVWGKTEYLPGSGLQMAAGYEGKGKGAAGAGAIINYQLHSQHIGPANSEAKIAAGWQHTIGQEGDCNY